MHPLTQPDPVVVSAGVPDAKKLLLVAVTLSGIPDVMGAVVVNPGVTKVYESPPTLAVP